MTESVKLAVAARQFIESQKDAGYTVITRSSKRGNVTLFHHAETNDTFGVIDGDGKDGRGDGIWGNTAGDYVFNLRADGSFAIRQGQILAFDSQTDVSNESQEEAIQALRMALNLRKGQGFYPQDVSFNDVSSKVVRIGMTTWNNVTDPVPQVTTASFGR